MEMAVVGPREVLVAAEDLGSVEIAALTDTQRVRMTSEMAGR